MAERRDLHDNLIVPKSLRATALHIIQRNLHGDRRLQAIRFIRHDWRTADEIRSFIARMEAGGAR